MPVQERSLPDPVKLFRGASLGLSLFDGVAKSNCLEKVKHTVSLLRCENCAYIQISLCGGKAEVR